MKQTCEFLYEHLKQDGEKTVTFFHKLSEDQWQLPVYVNDGIEWRIQQVLAHLVASEASFARLIKNILAGGRGAPEKFDIDAFNQLEIEKVRPNSPEELLVRFKQLRESTLDLIGIMNQSELEKVGRHPFLGEASLGDIIRLIYRHNQIHLRDLKRIVH